jgi:hypothetical protein
MTDMGHRSVRRLAVRPPASFMTGRGERWRPRSMGGIAAVPRGRGVTNEVDPRRSRVTWQPR